MKLLLDENLSRKLVVRLAELYPDSAHVADFDLLARPDREILTFAQQKGFVIVSTDAYCGSDAGPIRLGTPSSCSGATPSG